MCGHILIYSLGIREIYVVHLKYQSVPVHAEGDEWKGAKKCRFFKCLFSQSFVRLGPRNFFHTLFSLFRFTLTVLFLSLLLLFVSSFCWLNVIFFHFDSYSVDWCSYSFSLLLDPRLDLPLLIRSFVYMLFYWKTCIYMKTLYRDYVNMTHSWIWFKIHGRKMFRMFEHFTLNSD